MRQNALHTALVVLLWAAGVTASMQIAKFMVGLSALGATYPAHEHLIGWVLSAVGLAGAVLGLVAGQMVGQLGAKRVLIGGMMGGALLSFLQSTLPNIEMMLLSRALEGVAHLAIVVSAPTLMVQFCSPRFAGLAMTLWSTFFGVGVAIMAWWIWPSVGADLSAMLVHHAIWMLLIGLMIWAALPSDPRYTLQHTAPRGGVSQMYRRAWNNPAISAPGFAWLTFTLTAVPMLTLLPSLLAQPLSNAMMGILPIVAILSSIVLLPLLLRRFTAMNLILAGFTGAAIWSMTVFTAIDPLWFAIGLFAILGVSQGASFASVPELNEPSLDQALGHGFMAQTGNLGNFLGVPLLIAIWQSYGPLAARNAVVVILSMGALALVVWLYRKHSLEQF